jgi:cysteine desulfurase / selenocysteine lyase
MDVVEPKLIYLNNAADGWPKAPGVVEAVGQALSAPPHHPGRSSVALSDPAAACRAGLAQLLAVPDPARIVLTSNATHALNLALLGVGAPRTRVAVTSVGEHNSILRPLRRMQQLGGANVVLVGLRDGTLDEDEYKRALSLGPGLVVLQHASNVTGIVHDVARYFAWAKDSGALTLLDAAQTVGHIPAHPLELNADLLAMTGRKGLHGPPGTGALWVSPDLELEQVITGGTGVQGSMTLHPPQMPTRLEAGTPNTPALAGQAAALAWALGRDPALLLCEQALGLALLNGLRAIPGVRIYGDSDGPRTPVVSFSIAGLANDEVGRALGERYGIVCRMGLHCAPLIHAALGSGPQGTVRFSASCFTTPDEVDAALHAVREIAAGNR